MSNEDDCCFCSGVDKLHLREDEEEDGDGGNSADEGDETQLLDQARFEAADSRRKEDIDVDEEGLIVEGDVTHRFDIDFDSGVATKSSDPSTIIDIPVLQKQANNWISNPPKISKGEPNFYEVDNPADWPDFIFRPSFHSKSDKRYKHHCLPTGAMPVPKDPITGLCSINDWDCYYNGWDSSILDEGRCGATKENPFPKHRKGCLDGNLLAMMGLTENRMKCGDALFFYQLLLPFCDPERSGIEDDPCQAFYSDVEKFSNKYCVDLGLGGKYILLVNYKFILT